MMGASKRNPRKARLARPRERPERRQGAASRRDLMGVPSKNVTSVFARARRSCVSFAMLRNIRSTEDVARKGSATRPRDAMFAGRNGGAWTAGAFRVRNFGLDATTRIGGIKLGTACDGITLARSANHLPITQTTGRQPESMRARPSLLNPPRGARHRENMEGSTRQGGPQ